MGKRLLHSILLAASVLVPAGGVSAAPSCSNWLRQSDGTYWRECVNDDGTTHCYSATDGNGAGATEVSCK